MKHGRKPTRRQKEVIARRRLNPNNWLVTKNLPEVLVLQHRYTGRAREIRFG